MCSWFRLAGSHTDTHLTHKLWLLKCHSCSQNTASPLASCTLPVGWQQEPSHHILGRRQPRDAQGGVRRGVHPPLQLSPSGARREGASGHDGSSGTSLAQRPPSASPVEQPAHSQFECTPSLSTPCEGAASSIISPWAQVTLLLPVRQA